MWYLIVSIPDLVFFLTLESPLCTCGKPESVKHYSEDFEQYEEIRERLKSRLFFGFSCKLFLENKVEVDFQEYRKILSEIFEEYILSTKRFKTQFKKKEKRFLATEPDTHALYYEEFLP